MEEIAFLDKLVYDKDKCSFSYEWGEEVEIIYPKTRWWEFNSPVVKKPYILTPKGKKILLYKAVWYKEIGQWPVSSIYHKDGNPRNCKLSNLTRHNPAWGGYTAVDGESVYVGLVFKGGKWFVKNGREVEGPFPDMGQAMSRMRKIRER